MTTICSTCAFTPAMRSLKAIRAQTDHRRELLRARNSLDGIEIVVNRLRPPVDESELYDDVDE